MARLEKETEDMIYRIYITDMLRASFHDPSIPRLFDLVYAKYMPTDYRTPEDVIASIRKKLGD
jgi:hypothetical protein